MKNRRAFLITMATGLVALTVVMAPVIADELFGVITKVDVEGKKLTVATKNEGDVEITTNDNTELTRKDETSKLDLEKLSKAVQKQQDAGKKGVFAKISHENKVASKISVGFGKKKAN